MRHSSLKRKRSEKLQNPQSSNDCETGQEMVESKLAGYLKEVMQVTVSQCKESMVRLIKLKERDIRDLEISKDSLLMECRNPSEVQAAKEGGAGHYRLSIYFW